ncbi:M23 family metallopeptidase [Sphingomonas sp. Leaf33]|uniref:M23 family metallopeptidase n=1 Tax=Sphingomonas sp. Leaf33 TaxID=1736215 RepID=UPI0009EA1510|nr:M23 family metallopeptidase [Sphingomonas sp. Leaf33]
MTFSTFTGQIARTCLFAAAVAMPALAQAETKPAVGGPFETVAAAETGTTTAASDQQFQALFQTWKKLDTTESTVISIPSAHPVASLSFTSNFGVRSDPFRGTAAMHAGVDIPGPIGTPVYATADGVIGRAERAGGYGNLVEINHGKGIETRYGHLSKILVAPNTRVSRGQLIGLMGSTGRSTGSHLHYEVRIDGHAVNPTPYMQVASMTTLPSMDAAGGVGGPSSADH